MKNSEKIQALIAFAMQGAPLDKGEMATDSWRDCPSVSFDANKLTKEEIRLLKRLCEFKVEGRHEDTSKSLVGETMHEPKIDVRITAALSCTKIIYEGLSASDAERVIADFRAGKAFIMDCEVNSGLEEEQPREDDVPF